MSKIDTTKEMAATAGTEATMQNRQRHYHANDTNAQRQRLVDWFRASGSITTEQARQELDIMSPAPRIMELRARGFEIMTVWDNYPTASGQMHRMARYVYMGKEGAA